jgi:CheY-like chemotaxis protein
LSIVERLGRALGHAVTLSSKPGAGSLFAVTAPLGAARLAGAAEARSPALELAFVNEPLSGMRVLAIDNEPLVLDGMRTLLGKWGCRVAVARGLDEALEALAALDGAPDAIIADFHLDEGDGLSAIAALRRRVGQPVAAILATADRSREVGKAAALADVALLNKPLKPAPLRAQLTRCLALRAAAE